MILPKAGSRSVASIAELGMTSPSGTADHDRHAEKWPPWSFQSAQGMLPNGQTSLSIQLPATSGNGTPVPSPSPGSGGSKRLLTLSMRAIRAGLRMRKGSLIFPYPGVSAEDIDPGMHVMSKPARQLEDTAQHPFVVSSSGPGPYKRGAASAGQTPEVLLRAGHGMPAMQAGVPLALLAAPARPGSQDTWASKAHQARGLDAPEWLMHEGGVGEDGTPNASGADLRSVLSESNISLPSSKPHTVW